MKMKEPARKKRITISNLRTGNKYFDTWLLLYQAHTATWKVWKRQLSGTKMDPVQTGVLFALTNRGGSSTVSELTEWVDRESNSVTGLLNRMEKGGLVERGKTHTDRRFTEVFITAKGREAYEKLFASTVITKVLPRLTDDEIDLLRECLKFIREESLKLMYERVIVKSVKARP